MMKRIFTSLFCRFKKMAQFILCRRLAAFSTDSDLKSASMIEAVASEGMMAAAHDPRARLRRLHEVGIPEAMFDSVVYVVGLRVAAGVSYLCLARARNAALEVGAEQL